MSGVKTWHGVNDIPEDFAQCVTAIGVFDGIHRGHQQLITAAVQRARELDVPAVLMTFAPHPLAVVAPNRVPPLLCDVDERARRAQELGVDYFLAVEFSRDLAALSPQDFIDTIVVGRLHARAVFVGENFTFGHKASGTTETLRELGESRGFEAHVVDLLTEEDEDGTALSSSYARSLLAEGDVQQTAHVLGRNYTVCGIVEHGAGRGGRELGYPTANMYFPDTVALPADGVYCGWFRILDPAPGKTTISGTMEPEVAYPAAISIGTNPTFGDHRRSVEPFVLDQDADLYGCRCEVEFVDHLRSMKKFSGVDELLDAMANDVKQTRTILAQSEPTRRQHSDR